MAEEGQQGQEQNAPQEKPKQESSQDRSQEQPKPEKMVPMGRLSEAVRERNELRSRLEQIEAEREQQQEQQAQQQGEWRKLAEKRQKAIQQKDQEIKELKAQIVKDRRYRKFTANAGGIVLADAYEDAFSMVSDDEWKSIDEDNDDAVQSLIQGLVERKTYLAAEGRRGAGSGGSSMPVVVGARDNGQSGSTSLAELVNKNKRKRSKFK